MDIGGCRVAFDEGGGEGDDESGDEGGDDGGGL